MNDSKVLEILTTEPQKKKEHKRRKNKIIIEDKDLKLLKKVKASMKNRHWDAEQTHKATDHIMEEKLIELGYPKTVEFIRTQERWYA